MKERQLLLFEEIYKEKSKVKKEEDGEYPYIIYISTSKGNCTVIIYEAKSVEGCQELCSRKDTKGLYMGVEWAYFYTKKTNCKNFSLETYSEFSKGKKYERESDNRFSDDYLKSIGMRKIGNI